MQSWSLFNAYHSAYLGAKGIMTLLGVAMPKLAGSQVAIDLFPEPMQNKRTKIRALPDFQEFVLVRLGLLEQRYLWEAFQRVLRMTHADCWDTNICRDLLHLSFEAITPPRNHFLYKPQFWPLQDLITDAAGDTFGALSGDELDVDEQGFLLRLCFSVYYLFEQLVRDFAGYSAVIREQLEGSRIARSAGLDVIAAYRNFTSQLSAAEAG